MLFRVPDRGSGNPTPLGGWDRGWGRGHSAVSSGNVTDEMATSRTGRHRNRTTTSTSPKLAPRPPKADQSGFEPQPEATAFRRWSVHSFAGFVALRIAAFERFDGVLQVFDKLPHDSD
jgi:hypothetical protein